MNSRKKTALGLIVSGAVSIGVGVVVGTTSTDPGYLPVVLQILGFIFPAIGLSVSIPKL